MQSKKDTKEILERVRNAKKKNQIQSSKKIVGTKKDNERFRKMNFNG